MCTSQAARGVWGRGWEIWRVTQQVPRQYKSLWITCTIFTARSQVHQVNLQSQRFSHEGHFTW